MQTQNVSNNIRYVISDLLIAEDIYPEFIIMHAARHTIVWNKSRVYCHIHDTA